MFVEGILPVD